MLITLEDAKRQKSNWNRKHERMHHPKKESFTPAKRRRGILMHRGQEYRRKTRKIVASFGTFVNV